MTRCPRDVADRDAPPPKSLDQQHPARELVREHREWLADELGRYLDNEHRDYADRRK